MIFGKKNQENRSQKNRAEEVNMADMQEIGRRIAALRKAKNLTQAELAEQLSVSYQAVSNWERGESMPDIFKLPTLAAVLSTSVDALLTGETAAEESNAAETGGADAALWETVPADGLSGLDSQLKRLKEELKPLKSLECLKSLGPLQGEETLDAAVRQAAERDSFSLDELEDLAPLLEKETLDAAVKLAAERDGFSLCELEDLAPFLGREALDAAVRQAAERDGFSLDELEDLAPFLGRETMDALAQKAAQKRNFSLDELEAVAPFLSKEVFLEIALGRRERKNG